MLPLSLCKETPESAGEAGAAGGGTELVVPGVAVELVEVGGNADLLGSAWVSTFRGM